jgi:hypothetical protein
MEPETNKLKQKIKKLEEEIAIMDVTEQAISDVLMQFRERDLMISLLLTDANSKTIRHKLIETAKAVLNQVENFIGARLNSLGCIDSKRDENNVLF